MPVVVDEVFGAESVAVGFDSVAAGLDSAAFESELAAESPAGFSLELEPPAGFGA